jgi:hypothetical protein
VLTKQEAKEDLEGLKRYQEEEESKRRLNEVKIAIFQRITGRKVKR